MLQNSLIDNRMLKDRTFCSKSLALGALTVFVIGCAPVQLSTRTSEAVVTAASTEVPAEEPTPAPSEVDAVTAT